MITAVDTRVLIDVFGADACFGAPSADALRLCLNEGAVVACVAVWSETRAAFASDEAFQHAMHALGVTFRRRPSRLRGWLAPSARSTATWAASATA